MSSTTPNLLRYDPHKKQSVRTYKDLVATSVYEAKTGLVDSLETMAKNRVNKKK